MWKDFKIKKKKLKKIYLSVRCGVHFEKNLFYEWDRKVVAFYYRIHFDREGHEQRCPDGERRQYFHEIIQTAQVLLAIVEDLANLVLSLQGKLRV